MLDRYKRFKSLPCPEGKITRALATDPAQDMPWLVLAIDECKLGFEELGRGSSGRRSGSARSWRADVPTDCKRLGGSPNPVSVADVDAVRATIHGT